MTSSHPAAVPPAPSGRSGPSGPPRAYRHTADGMLGGVCAGLAAHLGVPVLWVRATFLVLTVLSGFGAVLYAALWLVLPTRRHLDPHSPGLDAATRQGRRPARPHRLTDVGPLVATGTIVLGVVLLWGAVTGRGTLLWPALLGFAGLAALWRQADEAQQERWRNTSTRVNPGRAILGSGGWAAWVRIGAGVALLLSSVVWFAARSGSLSLAVNTLVAAVLGVVGLGLMAGPWLFRLSADLSEEREARVRSEERADLAAHLHDSVLQTLALIQRASQDPQRVQQLARAQERDLRRWLFQPPPEATRTLAAALSTAAAEVEDTHGVHVEVVCVGDHPLGEREEPIVLAAREAMTNAARHSGAATVDVYAEITPAAAEVFVRDRGTGFDLDAVPTDRHGIRRSILDRLRRHGGQAEVRTSPGQGTEVRLRLPLSAPAPQPAHPDSPPGGAR